VWMFTSVGKIGMLSDAYFVSLVMVSFV
jgi:hypothetical protein